MDARPPERPGWASGPLYTTETIHHRHYTMYTCLCQLQSQPIYGVQMFFLRNSRCTGVFCRSVRVYVRIALMVYKCGSRTSVSAWTHSRPDSLTYARDQSQGVGTKRPARLLVVRVSNCDATRPTIDQSQDPQVTQTSYTR